MIITIGGRFGSGKTTVAKILVQELGYDRFSMGDFRKAIAKEKGMTIDELNIISEKDPSSDYETDKKLQQLAKEKDNFIIETRTGFHLVPKSFKVCLIADLEQSARRIMEKKSAIQPYKTLEKAMEKIKQGWESDYRRYKKLYDIDYLNPDNFDIHLDTTNLTPNEVANKIIEAMDKNLIL